MSKGTKIWLWVALLICIATTVLNFTEKRYLSVLIAICSLVGLCILLFKGKKIGFYIMCAFYVLAFIVGVTGGIEGGSEIVLSVIASFIGSALIPVITFLFIRKQFNTLS